MFVDIKKYSDFLYSQSKQFNYPKNSIYDNCIGNENGNGEIRLFHTDAIGHLLTVQVSVNLGEGL